MWEMWETFHVFHVFHVFNGLRGRGGSPRLNCPKNPIFPLYQRKKGKKVKIQRNIPENIEKCIEIAELLINCAEDLIDNATELQYLLVERSGIQNEQANDFLQKEVSKMRLSMGEEERTQKAQKQEETGFSVSKMYVPVFRLSAHNNSTAESN